MLAFLTWSKIYQNSGKKKLVWKAIPKLDFILDSKIKFCKKFSNISRMSHIKGKLIAVIGDEVSLKDIGFE